MMAQKYQTRWNLARGTMARLSQSAESLASRTNTQLLDLTEIRSGTQGNKL